MPDLALEVFNAIQDSLASIEVTTTTPASKLCSMGVGGTAPITLVCKSEEAVTKASAVLSKLGVRSVTVGAGTNIVFPDETLEFVLIKLAGELSHIEIRGEAIIAGGSVKLARLIRQACSAGLSGLEELFGIPGTVGGAAAMNAGAFGRQLGELVEWAVVVDRAGELMQLHQEELGFSYRRSRLLDLSLTVLKVKLKLQRSDQARCFSRMKSISLRRRPRTPPKRSAGSVFKNPPGLYAGRLLDEAGAKGMRVGGARVWTGHANVIVADRNAAAKDVRELAFRMHRLVLDKFGIRLEPEVRFLMKDGSLWVP